MPKNGAILYPALANGLTEVKGGSLIEGLVYGRIIERILLLLLRISLINISILSYSRIVYYVYLR